VAEMSVTGCMSAMHKTQDEPIVSSGNGLPNSAARQEAARYDMDMPEWEERAGN